MLISVEVSSPPPTNRHHLSNSLISLRFSSCLGVDIPTCLFAHYFSADWPSGMALPLTLCNPHAWIVAWMLQIPAARPPTIVLQRTTTRRSPGPRD